MNVKASDPKAGKLQIFASYIYPHRKLFAIDMTLSVKCSRPFSRSWQSFSLPT